jgi:hypothetical protein
MKLSGLQEKTQNYSHFLNSGFKIEGIRSLTQRRRMVISLVNKKYIALFIIYHMCDLTNHQAERTEGEWREKTFIL